MSEKKKIVFFNILVPILVTAMLFPLVKYVWGEQARDISSKLDSAIYEADKKALEERMRLKEEAHNQVTIAAAQTHTSQHNALVQLVETELGAIREAMAERDKAIDRQLKAIFHAVQRQ